MYLILLFLGNKLEHEQTLDKGAKRMFFPNCEAPESSVKYQLQLKRGFLDIKSTIIISKARETSEITQSGIRKKSSTCCYSILSSVSSPF